MGIESGGVRENATDWVSNSGEYRRTVMIGIESGGVPENPNDSESNPGEYRRTLMIGYRIRASTGEP